MKAQKENTRTVYRVFWAWQDRQEEQWLEEMAAQGWLLKEYRFLRYVFTAAEPRAYVYRLDFKTTPDKDMDEYKEIFARSGWEHVFSANGWQYLRIPKENFTTDIYTDKASLIEKLRRTTTYTISVMLPILFLLVILDFPGSLQTAIDRYHLDFMNYVLPVIFVLMVLSLIFNGIWIIKLSQRIKELEKEE